MAMRLSIPQTCCREGQLKANLTINTSLKCDMLSEEPCHVSEWTFNAEHTHFLCELRKKTCSCSNVISCDVFLALIHDYDTTGPIDFMVDWLCVFVCSCRPRQFLMAVSFISLNCRISMAVTIMNIVLTIHCHINNCD